MRARKRSTSRQARRLRAPKLPIQAARTYSDGLAKWIGGFQAWILERLTSTWHQNLTHNPYPGHKADARPPPPVVPPPLGDWITARMGEINVALADRYAAESDLSRTVRVVAARVDKKGAIEFQRAIGISTKSVAPKGALETWRAKNVSLVKSLEEQQLAELRDILSDAEAAAWRVEELSATIQERFDVTQSKADLLARDQTFKLNGELVRERQQNAGITHYIWTTSGDERVRPTHAELDGSVQSWLSPPVIDEDGNTGHPGEDYQCRCTPDPVLDGLEPT